MLNAVRNAMVEELTELVGDDERRVERVAPPPHQDLTTVE